MALAPQPPKKSLTAAVIAATMAIATPLVTRFEGQSNAAYLDPVSIPTICDGHTAGVHLGQTKTDAECDALLKGDLGIALQAVDKLVKAPLNVRQRAALTSFVFNVGEPNFAKSRLLKKLNAGDYKGAADEFLRWTTAGGQELPGLVKRRQAERALFLSNPAP